MLTDAQLALREKLDRLVEIDDELDELSALEDAQNRCRRDLARRRIGLENDLKLAYATAGYPRTAIHVGHRLVVFDAHRVSVVSYRAITPYTFATMACPEAEADEHVPPVEGSGVAPPMGILTPCPNDGES